MMSETHRRGQPLVALAGVLGGWVALRVILPSADIPDVPLPPNVVKRVGEPDLTLPAIATGTPPMVPVPSPVGPLSAADPPILQSAPISIPQAAPPPRPMARPIGVFSPPPAAVPQAQPIASSTQSAPPRPLPARVVPFSAAPAEAPTGRWSADGWVLWRRDGAKAALVPGAASYGASQAGAVLRYRLAHDSALEPRAHLRATTALDRDEAELAAGMGVRPLGDVPLEILAEGRVGQFAGDTRLRPAVLGVFGPPSQPLPLNLDIELYAQAGYVGGADATAFADGQMRVTRPAEIGRVRIQAGAGAWGGAQREVRRVDVGPTLSASAPVGGGVFARVSIDWRERVAGNAEPGSGPVVTISAGF